MGRVGDIGFALNLVDPVPAIAEFPVITDHFCHNAGPFYERHDDNTHLIGDNSRGIVKDLLTFYGKLFCGPCELQHPFSGVLDTTNIGIGFDGIKSTAFEEFLFGVRIKIFYKKVKKVVYNIIVILYIVSIIENN